MPISRNDPCPCGSGRKYKKCHGLGDTATEPPEVKRAASLKQARAASLKQADVELTSRLMEFAKSRFGPDWLHEGLDADGFSTDDPDWEVNMPFLLPWYLHSRPLEEGGTLAEAWRGSQRRPLRTDEQLLLDAYRNSWASVWEVSEAVPGTGSRLEDLLTRDRRFSLDVASSRTLKRFDGLFGFVLDCDGVCFFGGVNGQSLPPHGVELVMKSARRLCGVRTRAVTRTKLQDPELQLDLLDLWNGVADAMMNRPAPVLSNTDGDPMVPTTDDFELVGQHEVVAARLAGIPGVEEPEAMGSDTVFVVTRSGNSVHESLNNTIIGNIRLSSTRLFIETNSTRRADALRSSVDRELAGMIRFRLRKEDNADKMMAELRASPRKAPPPASAMPPEAVAALREYRERYMRDWLDMSIPMFGGLTPREAAKSKKERPRLDALLKQMYQDEERLPAEQRIDLEAVLGTLGRPV